MTNSTTACVARKPHKPPQWSTPCVTYHSCSSISFENDPPAGSEPATTRHLRSASKSALMILVSTPRMLTPAEEPEKSAAVFLAQRRLWLLRRPHRTA
jgi:hypothetical protein